MAPIVDGLEQQFKGQMAVRRINAEVGDGLEIMRAYRIPGHPVTMVIDADGNETLRLIGPQTQETLGEELQKILN